MRYREAFTAKHFLSDDPEPTDEEWNAIKDEIFLEETGIPYYNGSLRLSVILPHICRKENPEKYSGYFSKYWLDVEYLRLYFTYPGEEKGKLLWRFAESARLGKMDTVNPHD